MQGFVGWTGVGEKWTERELEGCIDSPFVWSAVEEEESPTVTLFLPSAEGQMARSPFAGIVNPA